MFFEHIFGFAAVFREKSDIIRAKLDKNKLNLKFKKCLKYIINKPKIHHDAVVFKLCTVVELCCKRN